jgi:diguanylate cyclase (GGDEF)-like protein
MQFFEYQLTMNNITYYYEARLVVCGTDEVLAIVRDITDQKKAEEEINRLAYYDSLTGLPNRTLLRDRLEQAIARASRYKNKLGIMFLDVDYFKRVNDTLGHNIGDLLLQSIAERLQEYLRKSDSICRTDSGTKQTLVARMGGDEFTILCNDIKNARVLYNLAQRICDVLSQPFRIGTHEIFISVSIGITVYPIDSDDLDTLLKNADTAMYHAKDKGRNNYQFYTESMNAVAVERFIITNQLRKALHNKEFHLYYQPQLNAYNRKIVGIEALVRWLHPKRGLLLPDSFIPIAEETSLIVPIGEWILETACEQSRNWQSFNLSPMRVSVNISSIQFMQKNFLETVRRILTATGLDPSHLEFELTESLIMEHAEANIYTLAELKAMGLHLSIDDFGTGYSSLSYLKRFPINSVKIDKSFVQDLDKDPDSASIVKAIIAMAHNLNMTVTAEGVETQQQMAFLQEYKCDKVQGYLFSPPFSSESLLPFLRTGNYLNNC